MTLGGASNDFFSVNMCKDGFPPDWLMRFGRNSSKSQPVLCPTAFLRLTCSPLPTVPHLYEKVKLFDFGGMDKRHLPFREIEPEEGNVVVSISYSGTGHAFLVCTAGSQPKVGGWLLCCGQHSAQRVGVCLAFLGVVDAFYSRGRSSCPARRTRCSCSTLFLPLDSSSSKEEA